MDKGQSQSKESTERASAVSRYDVFLSFRGSDTRKGFTDHLYHNLVNAGTVPICIFRDDNSIPIGEEFAIEILDAITRSEISIPIISENYASSKWCLRELIQIMDCKRSTSHIVLPIFYKVDPSQVRYLKGNFGKAFHSCKKHFDVKDIQEGQRALTEVSYLNGWESEKIANGHEGELVEKVTKTVLSKLRQNFQLDVTKHLVGIGDHMKRIRNWVDAYANEARMIGLYGMGGIGKTTLAKVIYNELSNDFVHRSFLPDIREISRRNSIPFLQNQLIKDIHPNEHKVCLHVDDGINLIKSTLRGKIVLILLDDIDHKDQPNALVRERNWFTSRSIIIVTTRNKAVLDQSEFEVDYKYELNEMDEAQSLVLFKRHAFRMNHSSMEFEDISRDIIFTMGGLPLALEITGSYLYGKTTRKVWQDVLEKLRKEPHGDVQDKLKISYDALQDEHKEIFLDIACFLIGIESKFVIYMWEACGLYPTQGIEELKLRCLIKIDDEDDDKFRMHDQLRDLGRNIVRREGLPERRSRLWLYKEAFNVLTSKKGTKRIQAICLDKYSPAEHLQTFTNEQFEKLQRLRFLQLRGAALHGDFNKLFSKLRLLQWFDIHPCLSFSATNLHLPKLVVLQLPRNRITEHWGGWSSMMTAKRLKVLDLSWCSYLRCTPDLSTFTKLEVFILKHCYGLEKIHPSIGKARSLISLDLNCCYNLKELPGEVGELEELKELLLDSTGLTEIPTSIGSLTKLEKLSARGSLSLKEIPNSIGDLQNLQHLDMSRTTIERLPSAIGRLKRLQRLSLQFCLNLKEIPSEIGDLSSLEILEITSTLITDMPQSIGNLSSLQNLNLCGCYELLSLPNLPSGLTSFMLSCESPSLPPLSGLIHLEILDLYRCDLLEHIPLLPSRPLKFSVASCHKLISPELDEFKYLEELSIENCSSIERLDISRLIFLKRLHIKHCLNLVEIKSNDDLESLEEIAIYHCWSINKLMLPELQCLKLLKANSCDNLVEIQGLDRADFLEVLDISHCGLIEKLPDLSCFTTLKKLKINGCHSLLGVESVERFLSCRSINITGCKSLEKLPKLSKFENLENFTMMDSLGVIEIPGLEGSRSLKHIDITRCKSIETLPDLSRCEKLRSLVVQDCKKLTPLRGLEKLDLIYLDISGCNSLETMPELPAAHIFRNYERAEDEINDRSIILQ